VGEVEIERPRDAQHGQLEQDQPQPAKQEEAGQIAVLAPVQIGPRPREEHERGRTEVGDPPREEDRRNGAPRRHARVDAHVVDRHEHHRRAAQDVDRYDSC